MAQVKAEIRVNSLKVKPFAYRTDKEEVGGECMEMRAEGFWKDEDANHYPVSVHLTVHPGHGVVPAIGDCVSITIERA